MRTIIDIPDDQLGSLAEACQEERISRAEAVRQGISLWLELRSAEARARAIRAVAGSWGPPDFDAREYIEGVREEWAERERRLGL